MRIITTMTGEPFESYQVDLDHVGEFYSREDSDWTAIPATFVARPIMHRGMLGEPTVLYGIDVREVRVL